MIGILYDSIAFGNQSRHQEKSTQRIKNNLGSVVVVLYVSGMVRRDFRSAKKGTEQLFEEFQHTQKRLEIKNAARYS